jgi:hypothetical protein
MHLSVLRTSFSLMVRRVAWCCNPVPEEHTTVRLGTACSRGRMVELKLLEDNFYGAQAGMVRRATKTQP